MLREFINKCFESTIFEDSKNQQHVGTLIEEANKTKTYGELPDWPMLTHYDGFNIVSYFYITADGKTIPTSQHHYKYITPMMGLWFLTLLVLFICFFLVMLNHSFFSISLFAFVSLMPMYNELRIFQIYNDLTFIRGLRNKHDGNSNYNKINKPIATGSILKFIVTLIMYPMILVNGLHNIPLYTSVDVLMLKVFLVGCFLQWFFDFGTLPEFAKDNFDTLRIGLKNMYRFNLKNELYFSITYYKNILKDPNIVLSKFKDND